MKVNLFFWQIFTEHLHEDCLVSSPVVLIWNRAYTSHLRWSIWIITDAK